MEISMDTNGIYVSFSFLFNPHNTSILGFFLKFVFFKFSSIHIAFYSLIKGSKILTFHNFTSDLR